MAPRWGHRLHDTESGHRKRHHFRATAAITARVAAEPASAFFIGTGVGIVVGGTLRTVVLDEVSQEQRSAAQALVNISIAIGNLLVVAVLSALADRAGGGLPGLSVAYLTATGVMVVMMGLSLRLQIKASIEG